MSLERIASALERQVEQHDQAVERARWVREDNIERYERDVAEARRINDELLQRLDVALAALEQFRVRTDALHQRLVAVESALRTGEKGA